MLRIPETEVNGVICNSTEKMNWKYSHLTICDLIKTKKSLTLYHGLARKSAD